MISSAVLEKEQEFFDKEASELTESELLIPARQIERYRHPRPSAVSISKDVLFARMGSLEGKRVLDYGCGHGENSVLLAACGAEVTAFDFSPQSILMAKHRAELHGVADRIRFEVCAAGQLTHAPASFDIVVGFGILHHLHWILPEIYDEVRRVLKPDGLAYFIEPMANSRLLRALRLVAPVPYCRTEGERQLTYADLEPLNERFQSVELLHFYCLERLHRVVGHRAARALRRLDHHLLRWLPFLRRFYGEVLMIARR